MSSDLIAVQCPHCSASLPPQLACGHYECDYCGMRFKASESKSAKTQAGIRITPEQLARMVAGAPAKPAPSRSPQQVRVVQPRRTKKSGGGGGLITAIVMLLFIGGIGFAVYRLLPVIQQFQEGTESVSSAIEEAAEQGPEARATRFARRPARRARRPARPGRRPARAREKGVGPGCARQARQQHGLDAGRRPGKTGDFKSLDPIASVPWATKIARAWSADAVLQRITIDRVTPDGRVTTTEKDGVDYVFYSPARRRSAREMRKVSEEKVVSEFRIQLRDGKVDVLQWYNHIDPKDVPGATVTCPMAKLWPLSRATACPQRPKYRLSMTKRSKGHAWVYQPRPGRPPGGATPAGSGREDVQGARGP